MSDTRTNLEEFVSHLEFLGFENEKIDNIYVVKNKDSKYLLSTNPEMTFVSLSSLYSLNLGICQSNIAELLNVVNEMNSTGLPMFAIYSEGEKDASLMIRSIFSGDYDKKRFGNFLDSFKQGEATLIQMYADKLKKFGN